MRSELGRWVLLFMVALMLCVATIGAAWGQIPLPGNGGGGGSGGGMTPVPPGTGGGIQLICQMPAGSCPTKQAREEYAKKNNCKFPEDVCEKTSASDDNKGAKEANKGFWGSMWNKAKGAFDYGFEFVTGVVAGLKGQLTDLWEMVTNVDEVLSGLAALGKAFYDDPKGTMKALGEMLGQGAVDTFTRATQCGAFDLGKVIGSYVSPAFGLKLATNLTKFTGKLDDAAKALRKEYGCASFAAGTPVLTADGLEPIESIVVGQQVRSRNENSFADRPQRVTDVFGRLAPSYRRLVTEADEFKITDEHPIWLQGVGWTEASQVVPGDVIASADGDVMVLANEQIIQPVRVYNFSVDHTPSYFVGVGLVWAHNARPCSIEIKTKNYAELEPFEKGFRAEFEAANKMNEIGYAPVGRTQKFKGNPQDDFNAWDGQRGIDGIYKNAAGEWVILESKGFGAMKKSDPTGCKGGLCKMVDGERQMSDKWINDRLSKILSDEELVEYKAAVKANKVKKVYAYTDGGGKTRMFEIENVGNEGIDVKVGGAWNP
jgi:hypothetical protein